MMVWSNRSLDAALRETLERTIRIPKVQMHTLEPAGNAGQAERMGACRIVVRGTFAGGFH